MSSICSLKQRPHNRLYIRHNMFNVYFIALHHINMIHLAVCCGYRRAVHQQALSTRNYVDTFFTISLWWQRNHWLDYVQLRLLFVTSELLHLLKAVESPVGGDTLFRFRGRMWRNTSLSCLSSSVHLLLSPIRVTFASCVCPTWSSWWIGSHVALEPVGARHPWWTYTSCVHNQYVINLIVSNIWYDMNFFCTKLVQHFSLTRTQSHVNRNRTSNQCCSHCKRILNCKLGKQGYRLWCPFSQPSNDSLINITV